MIVVACLNAMMAAAVCWLAYRLWRWRDRLILLNQTLSKTSLSPQAAGYRLTIHRAQIAQARLGFAQMQTRSQQLVQTLRLIRMLQTILLYRRRRYSKSRRQRL